MKEVATMESIYTTQRPSLLAPACAPSAVMSPIMAAKRAPLPQVHQVQIQAELARTSALGGSGNGTTGFAASSKGFVGNEGISVKTDAASGVPPRGRPV
jgi:hypothetical protein